MPDQNLSEILDALRIIVHALQTGSRNSEARVGLTGAQLFVLEKLRAAETMTVNELARATHTRQSTVSVVVSKLVKKNLVSRIRSARDARVQMLSITKRGARTLANSPGTVQDELIAALKRVPRPERARLASLLNRWLAEAGLSNEKPEFFLEQHSATARVPARVHARVSGSAASR